jgi:phytoene dehydrogenase-like protein
LAGDDVSTAEMLRRERFSPAMVERFWRPLFAGIQLDPELGTSRRMFDIIFRCLADGDGAVPAQGMQAIPDQMAARLRPGTIELNRPVTALDGTTVHTAAGSIEARAVVVATEGPSAAKLLGLTPVASNPVSCVYFAAPAAPIHQRLVVLDGTGVGPVLNVAVMSNISRAYAPEGQHLIACAIPGRVDGDLETDARRQLRGWWGDQVDRWRHLRTYRIEHGQPVQAPPFNPQKPVSLGEGRFVCGDHRDTGSTQGALFSGRRCGEAVATTLSATTTGGNR